MVYGIPFMKPSYRTSPFTLMSLFGSCVAYNIDKRGLASCGFAPTIEFLHTVALYSPPSLINPST